MFSVFPDFLQNTEVVIWKERLAVVRWVLSDFGVEKLHLLVVREYAFWLLFASKMSTDSHLLLM